MIRRSSFAAVLAIAFSVFAVVQHADRGATAATAAKTVEGALNDPDTVARVTLEGLDPLLMLAAAGCLCAAGLIVSRLRTRSRADTEARGGSWALVIVLIATAGFAGRLAVPLASDALSLVVADVAPATGLADLGSYPAGSLVATLRSAALAVPSTDGACAWSWRAADGATQDLVLRPLSPGCGQYSLVGTGRP